MKRAGFASAMVGAIALLSSACAMAETATSTAKKEIAGKWLTAAGEPTYNIASDGTVDWYTFSGFRRYHSECHTCHGPDGEGSSYAPGLVESVKTMSYPEFMLIVATGRGCVERTPYRH
jgi:mono/diheme cytochrome c family protein